MRLKLVSGLIVLLAIVVLAGSPSLGPTQTAAQSDEFACPTTGEL